MKNINEASICWGIVFWLLIVLTFGVGLSKAVSAEAQKIVVISALSGPAGVIGQSQLSGAKVAEMHINADGGILGRKIEIIERDTAAKPDMAVKAVQEVAVNKETFFYVGVVSSAVALAIAPVVEQNNGLLILAAAQSDKATGSQCSKNVFRITTNAVAVARGAAKLMVERYPDVKRWAGINPDYEYGHNAWGVFSAELKRLNPDVVIVGEQWPKFKATNYETQILKLLDAKPEGIYSALYASDFITFVKQARKYKFFDNVKAFMDHSVSTEVAIPLGKNMVEVWGGGHYHHDAYDNELNTNFRNGYKKLYNKEPVYAASEAYSAVYALKYAIEKANTFEVDAVIDALQGLEFESVTGKRYIRSRDHQAIRSQLFTHFVPTTEEPGWKVVEHAKLFSEDIYPRLDEEEYRCTRIK
jgi:branched-chain amino acid transport system substrate-binding protein